MMILTDLLLVNFRNYKNKQITFSQDINIIVGKNGVGKTNILEGIYVLGLSKSYKNVYNDSLIMFDKDFFKIEGKISIDNHFKKVAIQNTKSNKKVFINKTNIRKLADYIGNFKVLIHAPSDNYIITGSPGDRRGLLDTSISQLSKLYLNKLNEYNKILKLRNDYLKQLSINGNADRRYLDVLTGEMIPRMVIIYQMRLDFLNKINKKLSSISPTITIGSLVKIDYDFSGNLNFDYSEENLKKTFNKLYKKEVAIGSTLFGPHRDDLLIYFDDQEMKKYSSQGQQKMALLAYKLAEAMLIKEDTGFYPCLLLDDLFAELDKNRLNKIISLLLKMKGIQVVITANDTMGISKRILNKAEIHEIY